MATIEMTLGDTSPVLTATFYSDAALTVPVDLTGATVVFWARSVSGTVQVDDGACVITDATGGAVSYSWASGDTDTVGKFVCSFKVTFADTTIGHFPNNEDIALYVQRAKA